MSCERSAALNQLFDRLCALAGDRQPPQNFFARLRELCFPQRLRIDLQDLPEQRQVSVSAQVFRHQGEPESVRLDMSSLIRLRAGEDPVLPDGHPLNNVSSVFITRNAQGEASPLVEYSLLSDMAQIEVLTIPGMCSSEERLIFQIPREMTPLQAETLLSHLPQKDEPAGVGLKTRVTLLL